MNNNILNLRFDILDNKRQALLDGLLPFTKDFVLAGGTGLALQIGHRKSFDFDFFSQEHIAKNFLEKLSQAIRIASISVDSEDELTFFTRDDVKVTFLYYPFSHAYPPLNVKENFRLFTVQDIACQKAYTVGRRGEYRDYFDLYTILKKDYISFPDLIKITKQLYQGIFDEKLFLEQLVYFTDLLNLTIIPVNRQPLPSPEEVKQFFIDLINKYLA